ncbi:MAG: hypothetical protein CME31_26780 [Gimesia sp.]|nr:hypothetical protein [Gimesia sp.]
MLLSLMNRLLSRKNPQTIRFQLLLAVNVTLGVALAGLLFWQYEREMEEVVMEKRSGLNDEAIAIHEAVRHLNQDHGTSDVQSYINCVCQQMRNSTSLGHQIVVRLNGKVLQTKPNSPETVRILSEIDSTTEKSNKWINFDKLELIVGHHTGDNISVFVSENRENVRRAIRRKVLIQLAILGTLGLLATTVVNVVLLQIIGAPLNQLLKTVEKISAGDLEAKVPTFNSCEMNQLSSAINSMSQTLHKNDRERRQQMEKARKIQQHLLPNGIQIPGLVTACVFEPADTVAGDYYDFLPLADGSWLICVADVIGHGVPAAMGAAMLKSLLMAASELPPYEPESLLQEVNQRFAATMLPGNFASMFLARWKPDTNEFSWASAGHLPGIMLEKSGRLDSLKSTGMLMGLDAGTVWDQQITFLSTGDRILLFSDGVTETRSPNGELFGQERLTSWFSRCSVLSLQSTVMRIIEILIEWRDESTLSDDLTLVVLQCVANNNEISTIETDDNKSFETLNILTEMDINSQKSRMSDS